MEILHELPPKGKNRGKRVKVKCHCGKEFEARKSDILSGNTTSCGCMRGKKNKTKNKFNITSQAKPVRIPKLQSNVTIELEEEFDEEAYDQEQWDKLLVQVLDNNPHLNEELLADALNMSLYRMRNLSYEEFKIILDNVGALG